MPNFDSRNEPPRLAERVVELAVSNRVARLGLTGDLREGLAGVREKHGRLVSQLWYWHQAFVVVVRYGLQRVRRRGRNDRDYYRSVRSSNEKSTMSNLWQDCRYAMRMLRKAPGIATISILALALGIGMPTIMFTIVNGVFQELPVPEPNRIVRLFVTDVARGGQRNVSHHDFAAWREQQTSFTDIAGFTQEDVTLSGGDARPLRRNAAFVTASTFPVLGVRPAIGRLFNQDDEQPGATKVVLISEGVWQNRFAGAADVVGSGMSVDGELHTVVGVMPNKFGFPENQDIWLPLELMLDTSRADSPTLAALARMKPGVGQEQAQAEMRTIASRVAAAFPVTNENLSAGASLYTDGLIDTGVSRGLYTMLGAVSFVLLIACVNVANLLLARAITRGREIAVRSALGASRLRVMTQFLVESFVITTLGGVLGTLVAWVGVTAVASRLTPVVGLWWIDIRIDGTVLFFVAGIVLLGGLLAGILPAFQASSINVSSALNDASRGIATPGLRIGRIGRGLVVAEIALSCALLVVSGLLIKGVLQLRATDLGMPTEEIVTGEVELPSQVYSTLESRVQFFNHLESEINAIPGVRSTALMSDIPGTIGFRLSVSMTDAAGEEHTSRVGMLTVTPNFLDVLDAPVVEGRGFTERDRVGTESVVIVNRSFVERLVPDGRPVGRLVRIGRVDRTIVGVVPDLYMGSLDEPGANGPGIYLPLAQFGNVSMQVMVRTGQDPLSITTQIRDALERLDPGLALMDVERVDHLIARETLVFDIFGRLFLGFGFVALFLASIGLYGVMSFTVRQRTREWGVRLALGATRLDVVKLVAKQAAVHLSLGLLIGLGIAGFLSMPLANFFYLVEPWDRTVFAAIALLLTLTGLIAALSPVRRATHVHPLEALREE